MAKIYIGNNETDNFGWGKVSRSFPANYNFSLIESEDDNISEIMRDNNKEKHYIIRMDKGYGTEEYTETETDEYDNEISVTKTRNKTHILTNGEFTEQYAYRADETDDWDTANAQMSKVGYYKVMITGQDNYTGTAIMTYAVHPVEFNTTNIEIVISDKVYTSKTIELTADDKGTVSSAL